MCVCIYVQHAKRMRVLYRINLHNIEKLRGRSVALKIVKQKKCEKYLLLSETADSDTPSGTTLHLTNANTYSPMLQPTDRV